MENTNHKLLDNCIPINGDTLNKVWKQIQNVFPSHYKLAPVGSFMKKTEGSLYNDLDIAIECDWNNKDHVKELIKNYFGTDSGLIVFGHDNEKLHVFNIACKLDDNKYFQVDFMFVKNLEYAKFAYHSPDFSKGESKFKGMYASILLQSAFKNIYPYIHLGDNGDIEEYEYYSLNQSEGLYIKRKTYIGLKGKRIKTPRVIRETFISDDVEEILWRTFGYNHPAIDVVYTFESLLDYLYAWHINKWKNNTLTKDYLTRVKNDFLNDWQFKLKTSEDLQKEFEELFNKKINTL